VSDEEENQETNQSRAKTELSPASTPATPRPSETPDSSDVDTVTEITPVLKAAFLKPPTPRATPSITAPVQVPSRRQLTQQGGRCLVPRISAEVADVVRRSTSNAKYMSDYIATLLRMGAPHFQLSHSFPFLVGVGMIGELENAPRSTRDSSTREVFIHDIDAVAEQTPILASRVWALIDSDNAMTPPGISLGRSSSNDVVITEYALSKSHCRFNTNPEGKGYVIRDLNSTNGTYVNGTQLVPSEPMPVNHLDVIVLGRFQFQYFSESGFLKEIIDRAQTKPA
jgi:hypothetical protein